MYFAQLLSDFFPHTPPKEKDFGVSYYQHSNVIDIHMSRPFSDPYNLVGLFVEISKKHIIVSLGYECLRNGDPIRMKPNNEANQETKCIDPSDEMFEWEENIEFDENDFAELLHDFPLSLNITQLENNDGFWYFPTFTKFSKDDIGAILKWTCDRAVKYGFLRT